jgi:hypothetical protein
MELEVEQDVAGFLGVHLERDMRDGTIKLTQSGLTKRIVDALGVANEPIKATPAKKEPLVMELIAMLASLACYSIYRRIRAQILRTL